MTSDLKDEYDEASITPSDYTLYFYIEPAIQEYFDQQVYNPDNKKVSRGQQFKDMLEKELLEVFRPPGRQTTRPEDKRLNIARMDLVFDNRYLIKKLRQRGAAMQDNNIKEVQEIEKEIESKKEELYNTRICGCFVTIENNMDFVQKVLARRQLEINDIPIKIKRAKEPKNYIWENMAFTAQELFRAKTMVVIVFSTVLLICYKIQYKYQYDTTYLGVFEDIDC